MSCSCTSPKAPRACLLLSTFCRSTTWLDNSAMFFCAASITASRSRRSVRVWPACSALALQALADPVLQAAQPLVQLGRQRALLRLQPLGEGVLRGRLLGGQLVQPAGQLPGAAVSPAPAECQECERAARHQDRRPNRNILKFHGFSPSTRGRRKPASLDDTAPKP